MTGFEEWWDSDDRPGWRWGHESREVTKEIARAAWSARLSDEDEKVCMDALFLAWLKHDSINGVTHCEWDREQADRYAAVRRRLEGK